MLNWIKRLFRRKEVAKVTEAYVQVQQFGAKKSQGVKVQIPPYRNPPPAKQRARSETLREEVADVASTVSEIEPSRAYSCGGSSYSSYSDSGSSSSSSSSSD